MAAASRSFGCCGSHVRLGPCTGGQRGTGRALVSGVVTVRAGLERPHRHNTRRSGRTQHCRRPPGANASSHSGFLYSLSVYVPYHDGTQHPCFLLCCEFCGLSTPRPQVTVARQAAQAAAGAAATAAAIAAAAAGGLAEVGGTGPHAPPPQVSADATPHKHTRYARSQPPLEPVGVTVFSLVYEPVWICASACMPSHDS